MVTKGIIKSIDLLGNTCTVHIPFFETAGNDPIIETATVSNTPGSYNGYKVGDAVYVAFEDGNMSTPVVIGKLYLGTEKEKADPRGVSNVEESTATKKATLPADSKLTAKIDSTVPNTTVPYSSLSSIANGLNKLNTDVAQNDRDYGNRFKQVFSDIDGNKSLLEQTADRVVAKVSGSKYKTDKNGNVLYDENNQPIIDPEATETFGWELQKDNWTITSNDREVLTVNKDGLAVKGQITAESGHIGKFNIGAEHSCSELGTTASGIYSNGYIGNYETTPQTEGIYVGTDGIKLGKNFSVDTKGNLTTKNLTIAEDANINGKINSTNIDVAGLNTDGIKVVKKNAGGNKVDANGNEIIIPENATKEEKAEAEAREIVVFNADAKKGTVKMSGFTVEDKKLHYYDSDYAYTYDSIPYQGAGVGIGAVPNEGSWAFWAGKQSGNGVEKTNANDTVNNAYGWDAPFRVGHDGALFATRGEIGGFKVSPTTLYKDVVTADPTKNTTTTQFADQSLYVSAANINGTLSGTGTEYRSLMVTDGEKDSSGNLLGKKFQPSGSLSATDWRLTIGKSFGVQSDGVLYAANAVFDGTITPSASNSGALGTPNKRWGEVYCGNIHSSGMIWSSGLLYSSGDIHSSGNIEASGQIHASGQIATGKEIFSGGPIVTYGTGDATVSGSSVLINPRTILNPSVNSSKQVVLAGGSGTTSDGTIRSRGGLFLYDSDASILGALDPADPMDQTKGGTTTNPMPKFAVDTSGKAWAQDIYFQKKSDVKGSDWYSPVVQLPGDANCLYTKLVTLKNSKGSTYMTGGSVLEAQWVAVELPEELKSKTTKNSNVQGVWVTGFLSTETVSWKETVDGSCGSSTTNTGTSINTGAQGQTHYVRWDKTNAYILIPNKTTISNNITSSFQIKICVLIAGILK